MLENLLLQRKGAILKKWFELILGTYPADVAGMMKKDSNRFTNPVGSMISQEIEVLFKTLCGEANGERCSSSLASILKIRSVQDFSPSQAVGFVFLLKEAIEISLKGELHQESVVGEWVRFQAKIDDLALRAFDIYVDCREKVYEIRVKQAQAEKRVALRMMERITRSRS